MSTWRSVPLGEVSQPKQWPTLSKGEMKSSGFPVYGANGLIGFTDTFTHEKPTILIGCRGSCGVVHVTEPRSYANGNAMAIDSLDDSQVDLGFLVHFFRARGFRDVTTGTSQPQIIRQNIIRVEVPVPPLPEQRRIAEVLDLADALRVKRRGALAQFDALTQGVFFDMFGDPDANPKQWPKAQLASLVRSDDTINYGVVQPGDDLGGGVPLVRVGDLLEGKVSHVALKRIAPSIESAYKRSRLRGDEILVSCVGSIGIVALADESVKGFNVARAVARIPVAQTTNRVFVAAYLKTDFVQRYFTNELRTVSQPTLNIKQLAETTVILPPIEYQQEFARRVAAIEKLKAKHRTSLTELDALFASVQHRAFRGEL